MYEVPRWRVKFLETEGRLPGVRRRGGNEELLLNGKMTMSAVVKKVADRLTETMEGQYCIHSC